MDSEEILKNTNELLRQYCKKIESIIEIDKNKFEISKFNGNFYSERKKIRDLFSIPKLIEDDDSWEDFYIDENENDYPFERSKWKDSLSDEDKYNFHKEIIKSIKFLDFSYALSDWLERCVLYEKETQFSNMDYMFSGANILFELEETDKINISEKKLLKEAVKLLHRKHSDVLSKKELKNILKKINDQPVRKERRKRKIDEAITIIKEHGKKIKYYEPNVPVANWKKQSIEGTEKTYKMTDMRIALRLTDDDDNINKKKESVKKLRQRWSKKLKK